LTLEEALELVLEVGLADERRGGFELGFVVVEALFWVSGCYETTRPL